MKIIDMKVEPHGLRQIKLTALIDLDDDAQTAEPLGEGPTGDAVPDRIVRALIAEGPPHVLSAEKLKQRVGGNAGTVNRQAWTLASNAPDLQRRLRGWVVTPERGQYALSEAARRAVQQGRSFP